MARLPPLGVRERRARPRAAPGRAARSPRLGREPRPVTFVVSMRLGEPPSIEPVKRWLELYPTLRFKLDPTPDWTDELIGELARPAPSTRSTSRATTRAPSSTSRADPELYRRVVEAFPDAWIEDPRRRPTRRGRSSSRTGPDHLGRADPLGRGHRGAAVPAADAQHQAVALRQPARLLRRLRLLREQASPPTAAASSSSARAAGRSSTSPRCSTRTRRTTSRPAATTARSAPGLPVSPLEPAGGADRLPLGGLTYAALHRPQRSCGQMSVFRSLYKYWVSILTAAVVVQIFAAGYGAFDTADKTTGGGTVERGIRSRTRSGSHIGLGYLIFLGTIVLLLLSFGARGKQRILRSAAAVGAADRPDPARLDGQRCAVHLRGAAPDQRVHHPRAPRLDRVPGVERPHGSPPRPLRRLRLRPRSYSGSLCADFPALNGVVAPAYMRCMLSPSAAWSRLWQCSIQSPGLSARNATV